MTTDWQLAHPGTVALSSFRHDVYTVERWAADSNDDQPVDDGSVKVDNPADAHVIASTVSGQDDTPAADRWHTIMLDLDVPARLVSSTTAGHSHLYIDVPIRWAAMVKLLDALADAGVIEPGYVGASKARECTRLRLPGVKKEGTPA